MMSEILLDRTKRPEEGGYDLIKQRLQTIMQTLQSQKRQLEKAYQQRVSRYQSEIILKNNIIEELRQKLESSNSKCETISNEAEKYKKMIHQLKQQFLRIATVVGQISPKNEEKELKRVKSDYLISNQPKQTIKHSISPFKARKFDINSYFQEVKTNTEDTKSKKYLRFTKEEPSILDDKSYTSKTIKFDFQLLQKNLQENSSKLFVKTIKKGYQKNNWGFKDKKKENYVKIRDYKQNLWQETF